MTCLTSADWAQQRDFTINMPHLDHTVFSSFLSYILSMWHHSFDVLCKILHLFGLASLPQLFFNLHIQVIRTVWSLFAKNIFSTHCLCRHCVQAATKTCYHWPVLLILLLQLLNVNQIQVVVRRCSTPNVTEETTYFLPRNPVVDAGTNTDPPVVCCPLLHRFCPCPPRGLLASLITKGIKAVEVSPVCCMVNERLYHIYVGVYTPWLHCLSPLSPPVFLAAVLFGVVWSITEDECLPGGNLFGITILFICAVIGGKLVALIHLPKLPPFPPLLGKAEKSLFMPPPEWYLVTQYLYCYIL